MATEDPAVGAHEEEGVAHLAVDVAAQERPADDDRQLGRQLREQPGRLAVGRETPVGELGQEGHSRREELRKGDELGSVGGRRAGQLLDPGEVLRDLAESDLQLNRGDSHVNRP